jgi:chitinase
MASSRQSREKFIQSAKEFMDAHGFDGIDIDWEYPAAGNTGGGNNDTENLTKLVKEMKEAFGDKKGISVAVPAGHYLSGFDVESMQSDLDMINFMSYDFHGAWETPLLAQPGTNLTGTSVVLNSNTVLTDPQRSKTLCRNSGTTEYR